MKRRFVTHRTLRSSAGFAAAAALTASAVLADEPDWREVASDSEEVVEVDAANIRVRETRQTAWVRHTNPSDVDKDGVTFRSVVSLMAFDCDAEKSGLSSTTAFSGPRGEGKVVHTEEGLSVRSARLSYERPGTSGYKVLKFVCEPGKRLSPALKQASQAAMTAEPTKVPIVMGPPAQIIRAVNPNDYYPARSVLRGELGTPVVSVCVGPTGMLLREPVITRTSGFRDLDKGAINAAKAMQFAAGIENGTAVPESCVEIRLKFDLTKR
jgi:TonB family protein